MMMMTGGLEEISIPQRRNIIYANETGPVFLLFYRVKHCY